MGGGRPRWGGPTIEGGRPDIGPPIRCGGRDLPGGGGPRGAAGPFAPEGGPTFWSGGLGLKYN